MLCFLLLRALFLFPAGSLFARAFFSPSLWAVLLSIFICAPALVLDCSPAQLLASAVALQTSFGRVFLHLRLRTNSLSPRWAALIANTTSPTASPVFGRIAARTAALRAQRFTSSSKTP
eukprot:6024447-Pleurochrysis_carterae.AAC.1